MKKVAFLLLGLLVIYSCSKENPDEIVDGNAEILDAQKLLSVKEVNQFIENELKTTGDVNWTEAPANVLWSATVHGGEVLSIGYGEEGQSFAVQKSAELLNAKENIFSIIATLENTKKQDMVVSDDDILNVIDTRVTSLETIETLQKTEKVRYLEPIGYNLYLEPVAEKSKLGCDQNGANVNSNDYRVISPNSWLPWNFDIHKITEAWNYSTGAGITVGLIDTGLSTGQNLLGSSFNDGFSSGRSVQRFGTYIDSPWWWSNNVDGPNDRCGHGTSMAAAIAAPRNNDFMPVGVAYNCNLVSYRGTADVVLNDYHERKGVSNALKALGNRGDVKVISMSIGYPWSIGNVKDAVRYAYSRGKMLIAAGGTSTSFTNWYGVIFPASMSETVAVTGIKDNGYNRCDICHDGNKIDFTIVMQRAGNSSRNVPVLGFNGGQRDYVSGSSVATAMTAGIAALVWSRNPNMSRNQVLEKLKRSGEFYPNRSSKFGYGNINALKAVQ
ncbi:S8 family peptidase [Aquimarina brevivitae]|uniref:Subtilisin family serine protease n=1 Tax=Aquimarina brevivitae TaxID=323412 RepID=A0A4Q7NXE3_9FLAO|nr:S8/S53 family peptidase [Aquimarina brevivitae]RZS91945.1 subtilisin family serine protease [Aquimarina brevivitae]